MKRVLVTGGAGYVGSLACKALAQAGYNPITYDNLSTGNRWAVKWGPLEIGDIADADRLRAVLDAWRPVAVMHFAALALVGESMREPALYYRNNVASSLTLLEICREAGVNRIVFSSTCAVYGIPDRLPIAEDFRKAPVSPYGASKLMAEQILVDYARAYDMRHMTLRYFNAAGADPDGEVGERREVESHLIPLLLDAVAGRRPPLKVLGGDYPTRDGTAIRDYIHVSDLAVAHVRALTQLLAGSESCVLNLGTGEGHSVREVIAAAERVTGRSVPHEVAPRRPGDPAELVADPSTSRALLGRDLTPLSDLENIIRTAWAWQTGEVYRQSFLEKHIPA